MELVNRAFNLIDVAEFCIAHITFHLWISNDPTLLSIKPIEFHFKPHRFRDNGSEKKMNLLLLGSTVSWLVLLVSIQTVGSADAVASLTSASQGQLLGLEADKTSGTPINPDQPQVGVMEQQGEIGGVISSSPAPPQPTNPMVPSSPRTPIVPVEPQPQQQPQPDLQLEPIRTSIKSPIDTASKLVPNLATNSSRKFSQYMIPICDSINKLDTLRMTKIQQQFTNFNSMSNKLNSCFVKYYQFDISIRPINGVQLSKLCSSPMQPFEECVQNQAWTPELDQEMSAIIGVRKMSANDHKHVTDPSLDAIYHDSDDVKLVNDIVDRALKVDKPLTSNRTVRLIDISDKPGGNEQPISTESPTSVAKSTAKPSVMIRLNNTDIPSSIISIKSQQPDVPRVSDRLVPNNPIEPKYPPIETQLVQPNDVFQTTTFKPTELVNQVKKFGLMSDLRKSNTTTMKPWSKGSSKPTNKLYQKQTSSTGYLNSDQSTKNNTTMTTPEPSSYSLMMKLKQQQDSELKELMKKQKAEKQKLMNKISEAKKKSQQAAFDAIKAMHQQRKEAVDADTKNWVHKQEHERQMVSLLHQDQMYSLMIHLLSSW